MDHGLRTASEHGVLQRSSHWPSVEKAHKVKEPYCLACDPGTTHPVQVHHQIPFHFCVLLGRPDLELDHRNLISLCETNASVHTPNHHLLIGHLDSFASSNLDVRDDATTLFHGWDDGRIKASQVWVEKVSKRLKSWGDMLEGDKQDLRALMDKAYPLNV